MQVSLGVSVGSVFVTLYISTKTMTSKSMMWLIFCNSLSLITVTKISTQNPCQLLNGGIDDAICFMKHVSDILEGDTVSKPESISFLQSIEKTLVLTYVPNPTALSGGRIVAFIHRPSFAGRFTGLNIYASESEAVTTMSPNSTVNVQLPKELPVTSYFRLAFCMVSLPQKVTTMLAGSSDYLYENRVVGLSVREKNISGLQELVNITMKVTTRINDTHRPKCVFLNYSTQEFSSYGCVTHWQQGQSHITCSCDHLTYFAVLMVSARVAPADLSILTYITLIGCSISLFALLIAVLLFITKRKIRSDVSMKIHVNLAVALILLNAHFLPSQVAAVWKFSWPSPWLCFYMAIAIHFSLLASFSWMAVEGFHLYLLLVKVFNIYVRKYLLKLSLVGWGLPAVIVSIVVTINRHVYGPVPVNSSNSTEMCYINNETVKLATTVGLFSLVFLFNLIMLMVTVRNILSMRKSKQFGPNDCNRAKKDICTFLGVIVLLGTTWGLIFFSFGHLTIYGLYAFSILNPLQGFFIFLWFVMSVVKIGKTTKMSNETLSTR